MWGPTGMGRVLANESSDSRVKIQRNLAEGEATPLWLLMIHWGGTAYSFILFKRNMGD